MFGKETEGKKDFQATACLPSRGPREKEEVKKDKQRREKKCNRKDLKEEERKQRKCRVVGRPTSLDETWEKSQGEDGKGAKQQKGTYREKRGQKGKQKGCRWKRIDEDQLDQKEELDTGPFDS